jgi:hypothetical protein
MWFGGDLEHRTVSVSRNRRKTGVLTPAVLYKYPIC